MDTTKLAPATGELWSTLKDENALRGFVLIGGTALTMHIGHRISEDLDFAYPRAIRLPRQQIDSLVRKLQGQGHSVVPNDNLAALEEAINDGLDLRDYQQDYVIDGVKVTFYALETAQLIRAESEGPLRVATVEEIFKLKCLAAADRSRTRDWLDLYVLIREHGFTIRNAYRMFEAIGRKQKFDIMDARLRTGRAEAGDPGYSALMSHPPSVAALTDFLRDELEKFQVQMATELPKG